MTEVKMIPIEKIKLGDFRIRTSFDAEKMTQLESSVKRKGIIIPIQVRDTKDGFYELVAGERRLRASKQVGEKEILAIVRPITQNDVLIDMAVENIMREDLSFYERGRWVAKMKEIGWIITGLAKETGIPHRTLSNWYAFYKDSERVKRLAPGAKNFEPEKMPLKSLLVVTRSPIPEEKQTELVAEATKMSEVPTRMELQRATRLIEQKPSLTAKEAIAQSRSMNILVPIPINLSSLLRSQAEMWDLSFQDAIIRILREYLE